MIEQKDMPPEYEYDAECREWSHHKGMILADVETDGSGDHYAEVYGPTQASRRDAEDDLLRMVWSLQDGYDPRTLKAEVEHLRSAAAEASVAEQNAVAAEVGHALGDPAEKRLEVTPALAFRLVEVSALRGTVTRQQVDLLAAQREVERLRDVLAACHQDKQALLDRLDAQTTMIRLQQEEIVRMRRPLSARVAARVAGWVRG